MRQCVPRTEASVRGDLRRMHRRAHPSTHMYSACDVTLYIAHTQNKEYIVRHSKSAPTLAPRRAVREAVLEPEPPAVDAAEKPRQMRPFQAEIKSQGCLALTSNLFDILYPWAPHVNICLLFHHPSRVLVREFLRCPIPLSAVNRVLCTLETILIHELPLDVGYAVMREQIYLS